jgi:hypothetical protein
LRGPDCVRMLYDRITDVSSGPLRPMTYSGLDKTQNRPFDYTP